MKLLVILLISGSLPAWAESPFRDLGPGTGGGGGVVVCSPPGQKQTVELVDLVESAFYDKTVFSQKLAKLPWEKQVQAVVNRIAFADPQLHAMLWERVQTVKREFAHAMDDTKDTDVVFPAPQDLSFGRVPPLKLGCQVAGLAVFNDAQQAGGRLKVSHYLWKQMKPMHQAALILHESVYLMHRDIYRNLTMKEKLNSAATRAFVGFLFSRELEEKSTTQEERERFRKSSAYRGYYLPLGDVNPHDSFRNKVQSLVKPLSPYFAKEAERPLFLERKKCAGRDFTIKVVDDDPEDKNPDRCELKVSTKKGIGISADTILEPISENKDTRTRVFAYSRHPDFLLEDIVLTCRSASSLRRHNPGFRIYCGDQEIALIESSDTRETKMLSIKSKWDFQNTFLRDFVFE